MQSCKTVLRGNYTEILDERLCSGISEWPKQHFRCCATRSVHWLVKLFLPIAQSHMTFLMCLEEFIRQMHFHLPLFALKSKTTSSECTFFCELRFFSEIWHFHQLFLMWRFKLRIKTGWRKHSYRIKINWESLPVIHYTIFYEICQLRFANWLWLSTSIVKLLQTIIHAKLWKK